MNQSTADKIGRWIIDNTKPWHWIVGSAVAGFVASQILWWLVVR